MVAGVIGRKRFLYDLWGDAVNTASRMESQGTPGQIQVTRATYELLQDEFELALRGTVPVKGKGDMETWYLVGRRAAGCRLAAARWAFCSSASSAIRGLPESVSRSWSSRRCSSPAP